MWLKDYDICSQSFQGVFNSGVADPGDSDKAVSKVSVHSLDNPMPIPVCSPT